jgi:hypothetical protein
MTIKYTSIFHSKGLQNLPKFGFWFENKPSGNPGGESVFYAQETETEHYFFDPGILGDQIGRIFRIPLCHGNQIGRISPIGQLFSMGSFFENYIQL